MRLTTSNNSAKAHQCLPATRALGPVLALVAGLLCSGCEDKVFGGLSVPAIQSLASESANLNVLQLGDANLPESARAALARNPAHIIDERIAAGSLVARRGMPVEFNAWSFPLQLPGRVDHELGRLRWGDLELRHLMPGQETSAPYWSTQEGGGVVVLPADFPRPTGDLSCTYALDGDSITRFQPGPSGLEPLDFVRRDLTIDGTTWRSLFLPAPAEVTLDVNLPVDAQLVFSLGCMGLGSASVGDGAELDVWIGGERQVTLLVQDGETARREVLDLSEFGPGPVRIRFVSRPGPEGASSSNSVGDFLFLGDPRIVARATGKLQISDTPRNLVFVLVDTLRADHMGSHGYGRNTSPSMDALAKSGARFTKAQAQASWTRPAMASIFTGLYPSQHGVLRVDRQQRLGESFKTLAEYLSSAGFATASFVNNPQLGPSFGLDQGFGRTTLTGKNAEFLVDESIAWLESNADAPFFLYLHVSDPHDPYVSREEFDFMPDFEGRAYDLVDDLIENKLEFAQAAAGKFHLQEFEIPWMDITPGELAKMIALYDGEIAYTDRELGRLFAALENMGLRQNTLVVLTSDHGEEFGEHGGYFHGYTLHREVLEVPLIFAGPSIPENLELDDLAMHVDLLPTLLELLGLPAMEQRIGRSLAPLLFGTAASDPGLLIQETGFRVPHKLALTEGSAKMIWQSAQDERMIFDLRQDRDELHDLSTEQPALGQAMAAKLRRWRDLQAEFNSEFRGSPADAAAALDEATEKAMAGMGYGWGD